jgi:serine/threonine protein phosphatase 1
MITRLIDKFRKPPEEPITPHIPDNQRVYCIGDIHGRVDLLQQLHEKILTDATSYSGKKTIVYLGDYIDRGEQSRQVIELLVTDPLADFESVYLMGNHEQAMLSFIEFPEASAAWISFGGREALNSYGIPLAHIPGKQEIPELAKRLDNRLPDTHREFLQSSKDSWQCGSYYFVHAKIHGNAAATTSSTPASNPA